MVIAADKQRLEASVRSANRLGLYTTDDPTPSQRAADMDDNLLANILNSLHHVLHKFLPDKTDFTHNLKSRRHSLTNCQDRLRYFLNRLLLKDSYYLFNACHDCVL